MLKVSSVCEGDVITMFLPLPTQNASETREYFLAFEGLV